MKRLFTILTVAIVSIACVFAGGASESSDTGDQRIVTTANAAIYAGETWFNEMNRAFEAETGIKVVVTPVPGNEIEYVNKINLDLLGGSDVDVIETLGPKNYSLRIEAGYFMPLGDIVDEAAAVETYGLNVPYEEDGEFYALPYKQEVYCVFYNKAIFDEAGIPYPEGPWTWDEYVELATRLTDPKKGIYGSFMNADLPWMYMYAQQLDDLELYTEDGRCNFDCPELREACAWFKHISNDLKLQPSIAELEAENANWNYYALEGYRLAMFPQGNWFTRLLNDQNDYPKDWDYGVAPLPSAGENGNNSLGSFGYVSINKNAAHPEEARIYLEWLADNQWKYEGGIPAFKHMTEEQQNIAFGQIAEASHGQVTVSDLYENLVNTGMGVVTSDIVGPAAAEYYNIVKAELKAYNMDLQDLDTTMRNITVRVNEAIDAAR